MDHIELAEHMRKAGYVFMGYERYKKHDAVFYKQPPNITYARLGLTCRLEDVPNPTWYKLFPINSDSLRSADQERGMATSPETDSATPNPASLRNHRKTMVRK